MLRRVKRKVTVGQQRERTSLAVQWLRPGASTVEGTGLIPGWGTKILHAMWHGLPNSPPKNERMEKRGMLEK